VAVTDEEGDVSPVQRRGDRESERGEATRCFAAATHVQRRGRGEAAGCFTAATDREKELETGDGKRSGEMRSQQHYSV
jgi:hypothetical protein